MPAFASVAAELSAPGVTFVEVECRSNQALCSEHQAGAGGWPTVKSFTAATGPSGARFQQKTHGKVCDELSTPGVLTGYVAQVVAAASKSDHPAATEPAAETAAEEL